EEFPSRSVPETATRIRPRGKGRRCRMRGMILLVAIVGSLPVCFLRPFYGILLWSVVAYLNPQSYIWSNSVNFPWALAIAIPTIAGCFIFGGWTQRLKSREIVMIGVLWCWFTLTAFVSVRDPVFAHHAEDTWSRWNF